MGRCKWEGSKYGRPLNCPTNSIAHGLCGSGLFPDCEGIFTYNRLRCCRIDATIEPKCKKVVSRNPGRSLACPAGHAVTSTCGSGGRQDCKHEGSWKTFTFTCCPLGEDHHITNDCTWAYAGFGKALDCGLGKVMTGMCGSLKKARCNHGHASHGIRCCKVERHHIWNRNIYEIYVIKWQNIYKKMKAEIYLYRCSLSNEVYVKLKTENKF